MKVKVLVLLCLLIVVVLIFAKPPAGTISPAVQTPAQPESEASLPAPASAPTLDATPAAVDTKTTDENKITPVYEKPVQGNIMVM